LPARHLLVASVVIAGPSPPGTVTGVAVSALVRAGASPALFSTPLLDSATPVTLTCAPASWALGVYCAEVAPSIGSPSRSHCQLTAVQVRLNWAVRAWPTSPDTVICTCGTCSGRTPS